MRRWHEEVSITKRNWKKHYLSHVNSNEFNANNRIGKSSYEVDCVCLLQKGRFRKKDAYDCGNTRCFLCHSDKYPKRQITRKEEKSNLSLKEQKKEL